MLSRTLAYGRKIFDLNRELAALSDQRQKPEIPALVFCKAFLMLWLCRLPSFLALEQAGRKGAGRSFLRHAMPSADQMANISEILDPDESRDILGRMCKRLGRNKVLGAFRGHRLAVVDGHEINASYHRCCEQCQTRKLVINGQERIQFYHRAVIFQLVGPGFRFLLDFEMLGAHED